MRMFRMLRLALITVVILAPVRAASNGLNSADPYKLHTLGKVRIASDGLYAAYTVMNSDRPGRPYSQTWILDLASHQSQRLGAASVPARLQS